MVKDLVQFLINTIAPRHRPTCRYSVYRLETPHEQRLRGAADLAELERRMRDVMIMNIGIRCG